MGTVKGDKVLEIDYPLSFGNAFSKVLATQKTKFRYLHLSGKMAERDQKKSLAYLADFRRMKVMVTVLTMPGKVLILNRELRRRT
jgi:hypothetical protein